MQNRRNLERRTLIYYLRAIDRSTDQLLGHVANISPEGVMLICAEPIAANTTLQLRMDLPAEIMRKKHLAIEASCRWCKRDGNPALFHAGFKVNHISHADLDVFHRIYSSPTLQSRSILDVKRLFDVFVSFLGLILLLPMFLLIAIVIKLYSPGSVFYNAKRVGKFGRLFRMFKFRTMDEQSVGDNGPRITAHDDPRVTPIGRFLRQTKLNELPQLFNVLNGEMSLVGPRPEYEEFVANYTPEHREVLSVKPGITSLASILYSREEQLLHFSNVTETYLRRILPDKLRLDLLYVKNRSLLLDIDILAQTMLVLIPRFRKAVPRAEDILLGPVRKARRHLSWFVIDALITFFAISVAGVIWSAAGPLDVGLNRSLFAVLAMTALFSAANLVLGVQRVQWRYASAVEAVDVILSVSLSSLLLIVINGVMPEPRFPNLMLLMSGTIALSGFLIARYNRRLLLDLRNRIQTLRRTTTAGRERVLIVGAGDAGQITIWLLRNNPAGQAFHVAGVVDDDVDLLGTLVHRAPVLGICDRIPEIVREHDIGTVVFAIHSIDESRRQYILGLCRETSARTVIVPDLVASLRQGSLSLGDLQVAKREALDGIEVAAMFKVAPEDLRNRIHGLAQLARKGDHIGAIHGLDKLDEALKAEYPPNPKVASESAKIEN